MLKDTVGQRRAETMLQLAQMLSPEEALEASHPDPILPHAAMVPQLRVAGVCTLA